MESINEILTNNPELKKLCRMCLKREKVLKSMLHCTIGDLSYAEIYEQCSGFKISLEFSSTCTSICARCENDLLFVFEFRQKVQESEEKLKQILLLKNNEIERDHFLGVDDNFLDYSIESLELEKSFNECKFKLAINNSVKCITCLDNCETEKSINRISSYDSCSILCECGDLLNNRASFITHYTQMHVDKERSDEKEERFHLDINNNLKLINLSHYSEESEENEKTASIWRCLSCNLRFMREESLNRHLSTAHTKIDEDMEFTHDSINNSGEVDINRKKTTCPICGVQFNHRSTKINHMAKSHGTKEALKCSYGCGYSTFKKCRYQLHIDKHENPDKKYHCTVCNQEFNSFNTMNFHRAKHFSSSLTFVCSHCNKIFLDKRNFGLHLRLHTKENLFHCEICNRGFNRKEHLKNHYLRRKNNCNQNAPKNVHHSE